MDALTRQDLVNAMTVAGVGVVKTESLATNVACTAPEALLTALNDIIKQKEPK